MKIRVGLVGFGVIGSGVVRLLRQHAELVRLRCGVEIILQRIVDLDITTDRGVPTDAAVLSTDYRDITDDVFG